MIIDFDPAYRKYWQRWARFKPSTCTYQLFLRKIDSDPTYKRRVDTYIHSLKSEAQRQRELEAQVHYA